MIKKFDRKGKEFLFTTLNNKEQDLEKSGISPLLNLLKNEYDKLENSVSATLKHKKVIKILEELKKEQNLINLSELKERIEREEENETKVIPYLQKFKSKDKSIEEILCDLHLLGMVVYFNNPILKDIIIPDPRWLNKVFTSILDFGRKKLELTLETIYNDLNNKISGCKESIKNFIEELKGSADKRKTLKEIWFEKNQREKSIVDKISFQNLLKKLEFFENEIEREKNGAILTKIKKENNYSENIEISQIFYKINRSELNSISQEILLNDYYTDPKKRKFLIQLLIDYDLILPDKIDRGETKESYENQSYLVPFLFPDAHPKKIILCGKIVEDVKTQQEWIISYSLIFKPFAMWKFLFLRVRKFLGLGNGIYNMLVEMYWLDGFLFYFENMNINSSENIIYMKTIEKRDQNDNVNYLIEILIKTNYNIDVFFRSIHQIVKDFVSQWMASSQANKINYKITRIEEDFYAPIIQDQGERTKIGCICYECNYSFLVEIDEKEKKILTQNCNNCQSNHFLIGKRFLLIDKITTGGFGRLFKGYDYMTKKFVAIKERLKDCNPWKDLWEQEIDSLKLICEKVAQLNTSKFIGVFDDNERKLSKKFLVMDLIEGGTMQNITLLSKVFPFNNQLEFIRMMLMLLQQLFFLHSNWFLHRDIKPENLMWYLKDERIFYIFLDFGTSKYFLNVLPFTSTEDVHFSPPEQNTDKECDKSDIYSLGLTFKEVMNGRFLKIFPNYKFSTQLESLIEKMIDKSIENRPSSLECISTLLNFLRNDTDYLKISDTLASLVVDIEKSVHDFNRNKRNKVEELIDFNTKNFHPPKRNLQKISLFKDLSEIEELINSTQKESLTSEKEEMIEENKKDEESIEHGQFENMDKSVLILLLKSLTEENKTLKKESN